ncbi:MAG: sigma-70 family RNA polymerase sigma factor [Firmicutes bacterium]|nr:sigma-70 family RNA polymerase sigma factor [Bacillota bacterium]
MVGTAGPLDSCPDEALMQAWQQGDARAFEVLYARYAPRLLGLIRTVVHDGWEAEDVLQQTFLTVWRARDRYHPSKGRVESWIFQIGRSRMLDWARRRRHRPEPEAEEGPEPAVPAEDPTTRVAVQSALDTISDLDRRLIELAYFGGFSQREIACLLHMPLGTVKTRTRRALSHMRQVLGPDAAPAAEVPAWRPLSQRP